MYVRFDPRSDGLSHAIAQGMGDLISRSSLLKCHGLAERFTWLKESGLTPVVQLLATPTMSLPGCVLILTGTSTLSP